VVKAVPPETVVEGGHILDLISNSMFS